jgi:methyl-accepting chemotaxis protein
VAEISAATKEQANGIQEMSHAVLNMDEMTQQNSALAEQSAASARTLTEQIHQLRQLVDYFRTAPHAAEPGVFATRVEAPSARAALKPKKARPVATANAYSNGHANGHANGHVNGHAVDGWAEF